MSGETRMVESNGARLNVRVDGDAGKPWLLLSNSLAADLTMWDDQLAWLTRTHRLVRYDTRGHGGSSAPEGPYDFPMLVADMVAVLDAVGAERADVLALSLGGMTALGLALDHPERVGRMVICDARADNPPPFVQSWDQRVAAIREGGMESIVSGTLERWFTAAGRERNPAAAERAARMIRETSPTGYEGCARALQGLDYLRQLGELALPVLYVVGEEDMGAPKAAMEAMAAATPGSRLAVLPGLAHVPNMEDPQAFEAAVAPFLGPGAAEPAWAAAVVG
ncbi:alpha/beta fold hydrolase [Antarcticirhabdus aurantiaca]|uniref:Alpha/beta fold hydrolase n=1 Tax=Antarcticirhabdus aurantiaca TaxID=2606717 RepID=A0ACD4NHY5_9HYPH|nr:alpha/beta fold hydrolase [Antarcticirhabdus aurantiaca]WAJ26391.1 alpha/beta fold hydrolase [Jeongeuplla avenae]